MIDTPERGMSKDTPDDGNPEIADIADFPTASAVDAETIAKMAAIDDIVEEDLKRLKTVLNALADQLMAHLDQAKTGEIAPSEISGTARHALPLVAMLIQQEKKVDDQIQQRVGKAGTFAFDLEGARLEIGRRLTGLRRAGAGRPLLGGDA